MPSLVSKVLVAAAAIAFVAGAADAGEPISFPAAKVVTFKDADCFDRAAEVAAASLAGATRESPAGAACVAIKAGGKTYYVLPSALKPPTPCATRKLPSGPQATTYGSSGASTCPGN